VPALPPVAGVVKVRIHTAPGSDLKALSVLHFSYTGGPPTAANLNALCTGINTAWTNRLQGATGTNIVYEGSDATDLASATGASGVATASVSGTRGSGVLPAGCAVLINKTIARRYRGGKPRTYLVAGAGSDLSGPSNWTSAFVSYVNSNWPLFIGDIKAIATAGITITNEVNVSYYQGFTNVPYGSPTKYRRVPTPRGAPVVDIITGYSTNAAPASQRRRNLHSS
jgi:hypothetical protein